MKMASFYRCHLTEIRRRPAWCIYGQQDFGRQVHRKSLERTARSRPFSRGRGLAGTLGIQAECRRVKRYCILCEQEETWDAFEWIVIINAFLERWIPLWGSKRCTCSIKTEQTTYTTKLEQTKKPPTSKKTPLPPKKKRRKKKAGARSKY